jgi:hypothetical protein
MWRENEPDSRCVMCHPWKSAKLQIFCFALQIVIAMEDPQHELDDEESLQARALLEIKLDLLTEIVRRISRAQYSEENDDEYQQANIVLDADSSEVTVLWLIEQEMLIEQEIEDLVREHDPAILMMKGGEDGCSTPLLIACEDCLSAKLINVLARRCPGALRIPDSIGRTPLNVALISVDMPYEMVENWIDIYPESLMVADSGGWLPFHVACQNMHRLSMRVLRLLSKKYPDAAQKKTSNGETPFQLLFATDPASQTPFEAMEFVLSCYPEALAMANHNNETPLISSCRNGLSIKVIEWLLNQYPAEALQIVNQDGDSVLHVASGWESCNITLESIPLLIKRDPSLLRLTNNMMQTALHKALKPTLSCRTPLVPLETLRLMVDRWPIQCLILGTLRNCDFMDCGETRSLQPLLPYEQPLLPYECAEEGVREDDVLDFLEEATNETICALLECGLSSRAVAMPTTVTDHLRETIVNAIPNFDVSTSGVALTETVRPHLGPDLARQLVDHDELQTLLREDQDLQNLICGLMRVNKSGRRYFQKDPSDKLKGVRVLEAAFSNVDCLFLHLRENYALCMRDRSVNTTTSSERAQLSGRKRKADEAAAEQI